MLDQSLLDQECAQDRLHLDRSHLLFEAHRKGDHAVFVLNRRSVRVEVPERINIGRVAQLICDRAAGVGCQVLVRQQGGPFLFFLTRLHFYIDQLPFFSVQLLLLFDQLFH